jgi:hypothetical protein
MRIAAWTFGGATIGALAGHTLDAAIGDQSGLFVVLMAAMCAVLAFADQYGP